MANKRRAPPDSAGADAYGDGWIEEGLAVKRQRDSQKDAGNAASAAKRQRFIECPECGRVVDMEDVADILAHIGRHEAPTRH
jgi:hypothetical protein